MRPACNSDLLFTQHQACEIGELQTDVHSQASGEGLLVQLRGDSQGGDFIYFPQKWITSQRRRNMGSEKLPRRTRHLPMETPFQLQSIHIRLKTIVFSPLIAIQSRCGYPRQSSFGLSKLYFLAYESGY